MNMPSLHEKARDFVESMSDSERKLEILRIQESRRTPRGVFSWQLVRTILFATVTMAILSIGAVSILAVWNLLTSETAWRISLTFVISVLSLTLFAAANEGFADKLGERVPECADPESREEP